MKLSGSDRIRKNKIIYCYQDIKNGVGAMVCLVNSGNIIGPRNCIHSVKSKGEVVCRLYHITIMVEIRKWVFNEMFQLFHNGR